MAKAPGLAIDGLREFRHELRYVGGAGLEKELTRGLRRIAKDIASDATQKAEAMGGMQRHFASALKGRAAGLTARIEVAGKVTPKGKTRANPAFWGRKAHNPPNWVGNTGWEVGGLGGPYAINPAIRMYPLEDAFGDVIEDLARRAFPDAA